MTHDYLIRKITISISYLTLD